MRPLVWTGCSSHSARCSWRTRSPGTRCASPCSRTCRHDRSATRRRSRAPIRELLRHQPAPERPGQGLRPGAGLMCRPLSKWAVGGRFDWRLRRARNCSACASPAASTVVSSDACTPEAQLSCSQPSRRRRRGGGESSRRRQTRVSSRDDAASAGASAMSSSCRAARCAVAPVPVRAESCQSSPVGAHPYARADSPLPPARCSQIA